MFNIFVKLNAKKARQKEIMVVLFSLPWDLPCDYVKQTALELSKRAKVIFFNTFFPQTLKDIFINGQERASWLSDFKEEEIFYFPSLTYIPFQRFKKIACLNHWFNRGLFCLYYFLKFGFNKSVLCFLNYNLGNLLLNFS